MSNDTIRFDDGAAYERYMGAWSRLAGTAFLEWLTPAPRLRWLDVGCGNGAFTQLIVERCQPASVDGLDPSDGQITYARARFAPGVATFRQGDAMALPFADNSFDVAVMPLVIFFVPDPSKGVAEMRRVVSTGGRVAAYAWDMAGGGFPYATLLDEMRRLGVAVPQPPSGDASRIEVMERLWTDAGLVDVEVREIEVWRTFANFDDYWTTILGSPSAGARLASMSPESITELKRALTPGAAAGPITFRARANAVKGRVPAS